MPASPTPASLSNRSREWFDSAVEQTLSFFWNAARACFTIGLFLGGAYLIDNRSNVYVGLLLVGWSFARASAYVQMVYRLSLGRAVLDAVSETRANTRIEIYMKIDAVLEHPAVVATFERLQQLGRIPVEVTINQWREGLVQRFRARADLPAEHKSWALVVFEVRAGQLWKNGEYRGSPVIFHEVLIPDDSLKKKYAWGDDEEMRYDGVRFRVLVINGLLKLQVGEWDEETGHREPGQKYGWMAWDTITTFPLLLDPLDHFLPPRFLLLDYFSFPHHRKRWPGAKRTFFRQADEYRRALSTFGEYGENRLHERQANQFKRWLEREGFTRTWGDEPPLTPSWGNRFMRVDFATTQADFHAYRWLSEEGEEVY